MSSEPSKRLRNSMPCENCGQNERGPVNPLDCNTQFIQCNNPCGVSAKNTAQCESLPSQIENFTKQFFGSVVKTEVNGVVTWSLPCSLDVGLPANPRAVDEGLACYFLRLFLDGIGGLRGDPGKKGDTGSNGTSAFTITRQGFNQPTLGNPLTQILVIANPFLVVNLTVFIAGSGYYLITDVQPGGIIFATLTSPVSGAPAYIPSGALVLPTGPAGVTIPGLSGQVVPPDPNETYLITNSYAPVIYPSGASLQFIVPSNGKYLLTAVMTLTTTSGGATSPDLVDYLRAKLVDITTGIDVAGSSVYTAFVFSAAGVTQVTQIVINAVVTATVGHTLGVYIKEDSATSWVRVSASGASLTWVQIS